MEWEGASGLAIVMGKQPDCCADCSADIHNDSAANGLHGCLKSQGTNVSNKEVQGRIKEFDRGSAAIPRNTCS